MTKSESIPDDLVEDILLKLPVVSLIRFKCVSKQWHDQISNPLFTRAHFQLNSGHKFIVAQHKNWTPGKMVILAKDAIHHKLTVKKRHNCEASFWVECSCDGMLIIKMSLEESDKLVLWNPTIRKYKDLSLSTQGYKTVHLGFGYDSSADDYKVVILTKLGTYYLVEVLMIKSNERRRVSYDLPNYILTSRSAVPINGALYWAAKKRNERWQAIMRFDLANETFSVVTLPFGCNWIEDMMELEGKLCLATGISLSRRCCHIWVMKDEIWVKLFSTSELTNGKSRLCFIRDIALIQTRIGTYYIDEGLNLSIPERYCPIITCDYSIVWPFDNSY